MFVILIDSLPSRKSLWPSVNNNQSDYNRSFRVFETDVMFDLNYWQIVEFVLYIALSNSKSVYNHILNL